MKELCTCLRSYKVSGQPCQYCDEQKRAKVMIRTESNRLLEAMKEEQK